MANSRNWPLILKVELAMFIDVKSPLTEMPMKRITKNGITKLLLTKVIDSISEGERIIMPASIGLELNSVPLWVTETLSII